MKKLILTILFFFSLSEAQANDSRVVAGGGFNNPSVWESCVDGVAYISQTFNATAGGITVKALPNGKIATCNY